MQEFLMNRQALGDVNAMAGRDYDQWYRSAQLDRSAHDGHIANLRANQSMWDRQHQWDAGQRQPLPSGVSQGPRTDDDFVRHMLSLGDEEAALRWLMAQDIDMQDVGRYFSLYSNAAKESRHGENSIAGTGQNSWNGLTNRTNSGTMGMLEQGLRNFSNAPGVGSANTETQNTVGNNRINASVIGAVIAAQVAAAAAVAQRINPPSPFNISDHVGEILTDLDFTNWQCAVYAVRRCNEFWRIPIGTRYGIQSAANGFGTAAFLVSQRTNDTKTLQTGDIAYFGPTSTNPHGHIIFIEGVSSTHVYFSETNWYRDKRTDGIVQRITYADLASRGGGFIGWSRIDMTSPHLP
jgi:hypothetical protein